MYFLKFFLVLPMFSSVVTVKDYESFDNNWYTDSESEEIGGGTDKKPAAVTPAPIVSVKPIPPIQPTPTPAAQVKSEWETDSNEGGEVSFPSSGTGESDEEYEYEYYSYEYNYSGSEEEELETPPPPTPPPTSVIVDPTDDGDYNVIDPDQTPEPGIPFKIPFVPKSGPNVKVGTVLKPGGFNGFKPVEKPKQVQRLPYESWAKSPLSMAPKPKKGLSSLTKLHKF